MSRAPQSKTSLRADAREIVANCIGGNARLVARRVTQFFDRELAEFGLTTAQLGLMASIASAPDDTIGELARRIGLEASTLSRNLRTLESEGLVEIAVVEGDLRRRAVWLTDKGARLLEAAVPVWRRAQTKLAKTLSPEIVRRLADETSALDPD